MTGAGAIVPVPSLENERMITGEKKRRSRSTAATAPTTIEGGVVQRGLARARLGCGARLRDGGTLGGAHLGRERPRVGERDARDLAHRAAVRLARLAEPLQA